MLQVPHLVKAVSRSIRRPTLAEPVWTHRLTTVNAQFLWPKSASPSKKPFATNLEVDLGNLGLDEPPEEPGEVDEGQEFVWDRCLNDRSAHSSP